MSEKLEVVEKMTDGGQLEIETFLCELRRLDCKVWLSER